MGRLVSLRVKTTPAPDLRSSAGRLSLLFVCLPKTRCFVHKNKEDDNFALHFGCVDVFSTHYFMLLQ